MIRIPRNVAGRIASQCARVTDTLVYANNGIYIGGALVASCSDVRLGKMIEQEWNMDYDKLPDDAPGEDDPETGPRE